MRLFIPLTSHGLVDCALTFNCAKQTHSSKLTHLPPLTTSPLISLCISQQYSDSLSIVHLASRTCHCPFPRHRIHPSSSSHRFEHLSPTTPFNPRIAKAPDQSISSSAAVPSAIIELSQGSHVEETKTWSTLRPLLVYPQSLTDCCNSLLRRSKRVRSLEDNSDKSAPLDGRWWVPVPSAWSRAVFPCATHSTS